MNDQGERPIWDPEMRWQWNVGKIALIGLALFVFLVVLALLAGSDPAAP